MSGGILMRGLAISLLASAAFAGGHPGGTFVWGGSFTGQDEFAVVHNRACAADDAGNVFVAGKTEGSVDFDPGSGIALSDSLFSSEDAFVVKLNSDGDRVWTRTFRGENIQEALGAATDPEGNVYVCGRFASTTDFDPSGAVTNLTAQVLDPFVVKLTANGGFVWARQLAGTGIGRASGVAVDADGVVVTGGFQGTIDLDSGPGSQPATSVGAAENGFVWRLTTDGVFEWAVPLLADGACSPAAVALDGAGNALVTGSIGGSATFPTGDGDVVYSSGTSDSFVARVTDTGVIDWIEFIGGGGETTALAAAVDSEGNVVIGGRFAGTADFDPGAGTAELDAAGSGDGFVAKLTSAGAFGWAVSTGSDSAASVAGVAVDPMDGIVFTGSFGGTTDFDPGPGSALRTTVHLAAYTARLESDGSFAYAAHYANQTTAENGGTAVATAVDGSALTVGDLLGRIDLDPSEQGEAIAVNVEEEADGFLVVLTGPAPPIFGDINRDGAVNSVDVQLAVNGALGIEILFDADVNADAAVNAVDVQLVINVALGIG